MQPFVQKSPQVPYTQPPLTQQTQAAQIKKQRSVLLENTAEEGQGEKKTATPPLQCCQCDPK